MRAARLTVNRPSSRLLYLPSSREYPDTLPRARQELAQAPMDRVNSPKTPAAPVVNVMTIDVEDYFQVSAFDGLIPRAQWTTHESRVCRNTERMLDLFDEFQTKGTFFVLGWVGERYPDL